MPGPGAPLEALKIVAAREHIAVAVGEAVHPARVLQIERAYDAERITQKMPDWRIFGEGGCDLQSIYLRHHNALRHATPHSNTNADKVQQHKASAQRTFHHKMPPQRGEEGGKGRRDLVQLLHQGERLRVVHAGLAAAVARPHQVLRVQQRPAELHLRHVVDLLRPDPPFHLRAVERVSRWLNAISGPMHLGLVIVQA